MPDEDKETEEDWMRYASAGFGQTNYSLWDDVEETKDDEEEIDLDSGSLEVADQLGTHMEEIPRAPSPAGLKHLVRIGCCDACLGRCGGKQRFGQTMQESGLEIRNEIEEQDSHLSSARIDVPLCPMCENLFEEVEVLADVILEQIEGIDIGRLQLGARFPKDQIDTEEALRKKFAAGGSEPLKSALVNDIGRTLSGQLTNSKLVNDTPEALVLMDVLTLSVEVDLRAVYIYGRYRKLTRGIPQTRWPCRMCKGRSCESCQFTGLQYEKSVQDLIGNPLLELFEAEEHAFHGMGREDIDVRCLGRGRPFVIEMKNPKKRSMNVQELEKCINEYANGDVQVSSIRESSRSEVIRIKDTPAEKSYTIRFALEPMSEAEFAVLTAPLDLTGEDDGQGKRKKKKRTEKRSDRTKPIQNEIIVDQGYTEEQLESMKKDELVVLAKEKKLAVSGTKKDLKARIIEFQNQPSPEFDLPNDDHIITTIEALNGLKIAQRTPDRVAHRRADLIRRRTVFEAHSPLIEVNEEGNKEVEFTLRCESGTYVKETIHGDSGRTQPCLATMLKAKCRVLWLDVGDIHAD
jgi:tRNA pseudouridine synthase 10